MIAQKKNEVEKFKNSDWRVLPFTIADGQLNMAIDEAILLARAENLVPNTIRFYRWNPSTASIGSHQSLSHEIDIEAAKRLNVGIVRRISGGGAVYHDLESEITYSVVAAESDIRRIFYSMEEQYFRGENENKNDIPANCDNNKASTNANIKNESAKEYSNLNEVSDSQDDTVGVDVPLKRNIPKHRESISNNRDSENSDGDTTVSIEPRKRFFGVDSSYHVITRGLVNGLKLMGVEVDQGVIHCPALFINSKKISGNSQARRNGIILQHGTMLLHVDPELMYTILKAPEGVTKGRMVKSVRAKVTGIFDDMEPVNDNTFQEDMIKGFEKALDIKCQLGNLTDYERELIGKIKKKRYSDNSWLEKIP